MIVTRLFLKNINPCVSEPQRHGVIQSGSFCCWFWTGVLVLVDKADCSVFGVAVPLSRLFPDLCVTDRFDIKVTEKKTL